MSALRVARGFTGRAKIIKIDGGYHGHADMLLAAAGSGAATLGIPGSAGVHGRPRSRTPSSSPSTTRRPCARPSPRTQARWRRSSSSRSRATWGWCRREPGYLQALRRLCDDARRRADLRRGHLGLPGRPRRRPRALRRSARHDLPGQDRGRRACRLGVYGGRADIMKVVAPEGPVYQAGTLSGNPLAMAAGLAMLRNWTPTATTGWRRWAPGWRPGSSRPSRSTGRRRLHPAGRLGLHHLLLRRAGHRFRLGQAGEHQALRGLLPRHAGPWLLPAAGPARSRLHFAGAHGCGHRLFRVARPTRLWRRCPF